MEWLTIEFGSSACSCCASCSAASCASERRRSMCSGAGRRSSDSPAHRWRSHPSFAQEGVLPQSVHCTLPPPQNRGRMGTAPPPPLPPVRRAPAAGARTVGELAALSVAARPPLKPVPAQARLVHGAVAPSRRRGDLGGGRRLDTAGGAAVEPLVRSNAPLDQVPARNRRLDLEVHLAARVPAPVEEGPLQHNGDARWRAIAARRGIGGSEIVDELAHRRHAQLN